MYHFTVELIDFLTGVNSGENLNYNIKSEISITNPIVITINIDVIILFLVVSWSFGQ